MPINWKGIKTTCNRFYDADKIAEINDSLQYLPAKQRAAVLGTIIEESGGDPLAKSANETYQGLVQWGADRYKIQSNDSRKELANQLGTLRSTINNTTDKKSWSHGGTGSGYNSFQEAYDKFHDKDAPLEDVYRAFSFGYVRPKGKEASYKNRLKVAKQVYHKVLADDAVKNSAKSVGIIGDLMHMNEWADGGSINSKPTWDKLSMAEKAEVMKLAIEGGVYDLDSIRSGYNEYARGGKIYIKPENRGKFTALKERTGHSSTWFKEHGTPAQKKMATFALNSRKWKRGLGGNLFEGGGRKLEYHPEGDYYYGGIPFRITVTGHKKKDKPYWVTARTPQLSLDDVSKAYTAATVGLLPNPISAASNLSKGKVIDALSDMWLYNTVRSDNPNVTYGVTGAAIPEGSLLGKIDNLTNLAKVTDAQWDAAYNAALKSGNKAEIQRLRDLHFGAKAPNSTFTKNGEITPNYHGSTKSFNSFDVSKIGSTTGDKSGFYFTDNKAAADFYAHETGSPWENFKLMFGISKNHKPKVYRTYLNVENPYTIDFKGSPDNIGRERIIKEAFDKDKDAVLLNNIIDGPPALSHNVRVIKDPKSIKSADAITYDDAGNIIPLSKRDNFNINDIRYGLLPFGIGLTGYGLLNNQEAFGGRTKKRKR